MIDIAAMIILGRLFLDPDAVNGGVTSDSGQVVTNGWSRLAMQGAKDVTYIVDVDPAVVAAYQERERTLRALREI